MSDLIRYRVEDGLALIGLARLPVNALNHPLRAAIIDACERAAADARVQAIILYGEHGLFSAGSDIAEFGTSASFAEPDLPSTLVRLTKIPKPLIAAIGRLALGGGLELALACGYRLAEAGAHVGLSEINLGLLPRAGGTQRLPRLIGAESALNMILSGEQVDAERALLLGILDRIASSADQLLDEARAYAHELIACAAPARPAEAWPEPAEGLPDDFLARYRIEHEPRWKSRLAPRLVLSALEAACLLPLEDGLARELALFKQAEASRQSKALRHVFFAEREAARIPGVGVDTPLRKIDKVAVIGAGSIGDGIAMSFADAGIPVVLLELDGAALDRGLMQVVGSRCRGLTPDQQGRGTELLSWTLDCADLADADLVIEAVVDKMAAKQLVLRILEKVCKPGTIIATNTSALDVDAIAATVSRPHDVVGMHFLSPAHAMRLVEVVRGKATMPDVLATSLSLVRRIGKLPVISGASRGLIGARMLEPYTREAHRLVLEGATPDQVDSVLTGLDLNMGVFSVLDLAGVDVNFLRNNAHCSTIGHDESCGRSEAALHALGRYGQKIGRGFYIYEGRGGNSAHEVAAQAGEMQISRRVIGEREIHDRCLLMLINEGIQLLDEGVALRAGDIDLVWINGYGFPAHLGGPMHYAEQLGLERVLADIRHYRGALGDHGAVWFQPAPLLERLVAAGKTRIERI